MQKDKQTVFTDSWEMSNAQQEVWVTVCIPTYRRADDLKKALQSAIGQDYPYLKIVVSDNGDSDEVESVVNQFASSGRPVKCIRQKQNLGSAGNFNFLLNSVETEYFMWLADDDWIDPHYIKACMIEHQKRGNLILVSGMGIFYADQNKSHDCQGISLLQNWGFLRMFQYWMKVLGNSIFYGVYRKSLMKGLFIEEYSGSDVMFLSEVVLRGKMTTLSEIHIHRSLGISSVKAKHPSAILNLFEERYLRMKIVPNVFAYFFKTRNKVLATFYSFIFLLVSLWRFMVLREFSSLRVKFKLGTRFRNLTRKMGLTLACDKEF